ncbi:MAG: DUF3386 family protein [Cyanobacteria bacterium J06639_1]
MRWVCLGAIAWFAFAGVVPAIAAVSFSENAPVAGSALDLFRTAYESRNTWDDDFPGYESEVSVRYEGQVYLGRVEVYPDGRVDILNLENPDVQQLIKTELASVYQQRTRVPFAAEHGASAFEWVSRDRPTVIRERAPNSDITYRVQDGKIVGEDRTRGGEAISTDVLGFIQPAGGYVATDFRVTERDPATRALLAQREYRDYYMKISKYYLLHRRTIRQSEGAPLMPKALPDISLIFSAVHALPEDRDR